MSATQDNIRALEQMRQRLSQLSTSLASLTGDLQRNDPLPTWPSIQNSANLLSLNLNNLMTIFENNRTFFTAAHAYPLPSYPGKTEETLLNQLLRKKLDPKVEDWIEHGVRQAEPASQTNGHGTITNGATAQEQTATLTHEELADLWSWAGPESNNIVRKIGEDDGFDDDFTLAEREQGVENVVTGLKRKLWESDSEDEEEGDDKMKAVVPTGETSATPTFGSRKGVDESRAPMALESVLKFMAMGELKQYDRGKERFV